MPRMLEDSTMVMFLRPFHIMFYKLRLLASLESKEVSSQDEPKNGQGVVRGMCILPSRGDILLIILLLTTEQDQTGLITEYKHQAKK